MWKLRHRMSLAWGPDLWLLCPYRVHQTWSLVPRGSVVSLLCLSTQHWLTRGGKQLVQGHTAEAGCEHSLKRKCSENASSPCRWELFLLLSHIASLPPTLTVLSPPCQQQGGLPVFTLSPTASPPPPQAWKECSSCCVLPYCWGNAEPRTWQGCISRASSTVVTGLGLEPRFPKPLSFCHCLPLEGRPWNRQLAHAGPHCLASYPHPGLDPAGYVLWRHPGRCTIPELTIRFHQGSAQLVSQGRYPGHVPRDRTGRQETQDPSSWPKAELRGFLSRGKVGRVQKLCLTVKQGGEDMGGLTSAPLPRCVRPALERWGKQGPEKLSCYSRVTQLVNSVHLSCLTGSLHWAGDRQPSGSQLKLKHWTCQSPGGRGQGQVGQQLLAQSHKLDDMRALKTRGGPSTWVWIAVRRDPGKQSSRYQGRKSIPARHNHTSKNPEECGKASSSVLSEAQGQKEGDRMQEGAVRLGNQIRIRESEEPGFCRKEGRSGRKSGSSHIGASSPSSLLLKGGFPIQCHAGRDCTRAVRLLLGVVAPAQQLTKPGWGAWELLLREGDVSGLEDVWGLGKKEGKLSQVPKSAALRQVTQISRKGAYSLLGKGPLPGGEAGRTELSLPDAALRASASQPNPEKTSISAGRKAGRLKVREGFQGCHARSILGSTVYQLGDLGQIDPSLLQDSVATPLKCDFEEGEALQAESLESVSGGDVTSALP
ncbi:hypothetical protein Cadr_000006158 [Camelus dromedarius]|uniref:Uncharacterized protein n=1 Tax=Camelus dromedarius TaxID=9838 RepID=A0A5N4E244_CAMDR|nr:hypothetical protein Cadr_000006158 [Camelus dromedarius]